MTSTASGRPNRTAVILLIAAGCTIAMTACGPDVNAREAPATASVEDFCLTYVKQATTIQEKVKTALTSGTDELPGGDEFAEAFHDWAAEMVKVGTPANISDDARKGFEHAVNEAARVNADELDPEEMLKVDPATEWDELSSEEFDATRAINTYVQDTCTDIYRERGLM